ncbi:hypothetical protein QWY77_09305 [Thalassotalea ponticola]|uniref:hypothetical protein n=1 Tax=Thalassotalea ponticola TaxID=1523392 RepID=UPI0025B2C045|nr:hypothetical protein [Thalassotalea ponticola]MDN3652953.1 hypothetical protein [Thalassotalea ponticola]
MNLKVLLISFLLFNSDALLATELCDSKSNKCSQTGSGAAWLLSIFESSLDICPSSEEIKYWLKENKWLIDKVKSEEPEYPYMLEMQSKIFWKVGVPEIHINCDKVKELIRKEHPLNSSLR